ncbi:MAG: family 43 glycosylhydrolase [Prolixibacteraceae bacterium]
MKRIFLIFLFSTTLGISFAVQGQNRARTYCNPLNINYGLSQRGRHAADPVVVLFKDKYYLFTTWDIKGYRVSDDLFTWKDIHFSDLTWQKVSCKGTLTAPAVATDGSYLYYINYNSGARTEPVQIFRTASPDSGNWEICGSMRTVSDPCLYIEKDHFYVYYGLGASQPTQCFELDPKTFTEIPGSNKVLRPALSGIADYSGGYNRGRRELFEQTDATCWFGKFKNEPCPEAPWMTKYKNKYYLQYATPGTVSQWYSDIVIEGNDPMGPFKESNYNPVSLKVGGFIGSAGHSCVFTDKTGRWWRITTMWVGKHDLFERRLGLFPVTFDKSGRMITHTLYGDYPIFKDYTTKKNELVSPGWHLLSFGKKVMASSSLDTCRAENATDENIRTWWSAQTGKPGEWFEMDLGKLCRINAIQVNFAEQNFDLQANITSDFHAYKIFSSIDGKTWTLLLDKSKNQSCIPNDFTEFEMAFNSRYIKIENFHAAMSGKFALSDLRIFGDGAGKAPERVKIQTLQRDESDTRNATISWSRSPDAEGYMVRFGVDPDFLNECIQVNEKEKTSLGIHILFRDQPYYFRIDSYNDSGTTEGLPLAPMIKNKLVKK